MTPPPHDGIGRAHRPDGVAAVICSAGAHAGRFIYAGVADRLVHPREQAIRLWRHWGKPEIVWYPGGHTGFFRSRPVQQFVEDALHQSGLLGGMPTLSDRSA